MTNPHPSLDRVEELIEPLTDAEAEATFIALVDTLDRLGCCPVVTVASKEDEGVSFSLHFSAKRARKLIEPRPVSEPVTVMENYRAVVGALVIARTVVASDAAACAAFAGPGETSEPERVLTIIDEALTRIGCSE